MAKGAVFTVGDDDRALRRRLLAAMTVGFVALIAVGIAAFITIERAQLYAARVDHTYVTRDAIGSLQILLERSETARRGFLLSGDATFRQTYRNSAARLVPQADRIATMTADNPRQVASAAKLRQRLSALVRVRDRSMNRAEVGQIAGALADFQNDGSVELIRAIRARLAAMAAEETFLLTTRSAEQGRIATLLLVILGAAGALILAVAALSLLTVSRYVQDLGASLGRVQALNETLEARVAERTADLSRANEEIQRFAYIVSHDLRSPLVNVMGFTAEMATGADDLRALVDRVEADAPHLLTPEARDAAREDLPEAIGFIRTSTEKMDRLINAILHLSRQGRRTITPEPLDMAAQVAAIRDTLRHRLEAAGAEIVIAAPLPAIVSDRLAIEQIFANVIENAVKYLDPARPGRIVVRGHADAHRATFEVVDNGRGIAAQDHARVFDLFRRAGTQDQPGEGIGLAHVRALTYRLGGSIDVASQLGEGATFRIVLPVSLAPPLEDTP